MKIVLVSFSQDMNILNPEDSQSYIVVGEEETQEVTRIPVPLETVQAIAAFVEELKGGSEEEGPEQSNGAAEEPEPAPVEPAPSAPGRKRLVTPPTQGLRRAAAAVQPLPESEDDVPSV